MIYNSIEDGTAWNKDTLIQIRDYEQKVMNLPEWKNMCQASPIAAGETENVACDPSSFTTPLALIPDPTKLEQMTDAEIT